VIVRGGMVLSWLSAVLVECIYHRFHLQQLDTSKAQSRLGSSSLLVHDLRN